MPIAERYQTLGAYIKNRRRELGLTQRDLVGKLKSYGIGITQPTIAHWEANRYMPPVDDPKFVSILAEIFKVTEEEILNAVGFNLDIDPESDRNSGNEPRTWHRNDSR